VPRRRGDRVQTRPGLDATATHAEVHGRRAQDRSAPVLALALATTLAAAPAGSADEPFLRQYAETQGFRAGRPAAVSLSRDGRVAWFLRSGPRSRVMSLFETDLATGLTRELVSPAQLGGASEPTAAEAARMERARSTARGITGYVTSPDGAVVAVVGAGRLLALGRGEGGLRPLAEGVVDPRFAPDGRSIAYVKGRDLHVLQLRSGRERRLTRAIGPGVTNGLAEFVAQEEMRRPEGYWWSPDSTRLAFAEVDEAPVEVRTLCDPARPEKPCRAIAYPAAGRPNARVRLGVVRAAGGSPTWVRWDSARFPYLATVRWQEGGPLAIVVMDRRQRVEQLLAVDPATGATSLLLEERDDDWLELDQSFPAFRRDGSFYWYTERNGGPEIELRAARGALLRSVVPPSAGYVRLAGHDRDDDVLAFVAAPDPTRTEVLVARAGGAPARAPVGGEGPATHTALLAERGGVVAVTRSTLREQARTSVWTLDGRKLADLPSVAEEPPFAATTELRRVGSGEGLWTALVRPRQATTSPLPVLLDVYGGPAGPRAVHAPMPLEQWLADQGFLVVRVDGRGTHRRGRAFSRAIRDFGDVILDDQIAGLRGLSTEVPGLDLSRVGIMGWSYGGYAAALAVLRRPDVFHAAVAGAPVVDWRDYDTFYTERFMGLPEENGEAYERASLLPLAAGLSRPLLLVHGTGDDNVWFSHTLRLADALLRAGRPFLLLPVGGATHMVPDPVASRRVKEASVAFLATHLSARVVVPPASPGGASAVAPAASSR
jgi:dipeptidyl-peptidase-4